MTTLYEYHPGLWLTELVLEDEGIAVRGAVILGSERAVVWDSLSHPRNMQPVLPLVRGHPLTVVYSHADWDHAWGTAGLPYERVAAHEVCLERFALDVPTTLHQKQAAQPGVWDDVVLVPPTEVFLDALTLDLGGVTLALHALPGHTHDCIVGLIPEWGVLLAGDTVETPLPVINEDSPLNHWIAGLAMWAEDPRVRIVIPSHGTIGGRALIRQTLAYLRGLRHGSRAAPEDLDDFYREAHESNVEYAQRYSAGKRSEGTT